MIRRRVCVASTPFTFDKAPTTTAARRAFTIDSTFDPNGAGPARVLDRGAPGGMTAPEYRPRFRPRKISMPIPDLEANATKARIEDQTYVREGERRSLVHRARRVGSLKLGTVPHERTVADAFQFLRAFCADKRWLFDGNSYTEWVEEQQRQRVGSSDTRSESTDGSSPSNESKDKNNNRRDPLTAADGAEARRFWRHYKSAAHSVAASSGLDSAPDTVHTIVPESPNAVDRTESPSNAVIVEVYESNDTSGEPSSVVEGDSDPFKQRSTAQQTESERLWALLARTPLDSPVHGALALQGRALVERAVVRDAAVQFPRLRSQHLNTIRHTLTSLTPCCRVATSIGLTHITGTSTDVGLWRERNYVEARRDWAATKVKAHQERVNRGDQSQRLWYYKRMRKACSKSLARFPATMEELRPRIEWLQNQLFAFIAFIEIVDGSQVALNLTRRLFSAELSFGVGGEDGSVLPAPEEIHPLTAQQEKQDLRNASSRHRQGAEAPEDAFVTRDVERWGIEGFTRRVETARIKREVDAMRQTASPDRHRAEGTSPEDGAREAAELLRAIPEIVVRAVRPSNALREAQLLLKYSPAVPEHMRSSIVDFEVTRTDTAEMKTGNYNQFTTADNFYAPKTVAVRMLACGKPPSSQEHAATYRTEQEELEKEEVDLNPLSQQQGSKSPKKKRAIEVLAAADGTSLEHAMNNAATRMLQEYYFRRPTMRPQPHVE